MVSVNNVISERTQALYQLEGSVIERVYHINYLLTDIKARIAEEALDLC